jgi:hypothetical protein
MGERKQAIKLKTETKHTHKIADWTYENTYTL